MPALRENRYGKTGVRLIKVTRQGAVHELLEWTVRVLLEGEYSAVYLRGDNADVLATDTMKNTVYARAQQTSAATMEGFATELADFLLVRNSRVSAVEVHIEAALWKRLSIEGVPHPNSFMKGSGEVATATLRRTREAVALTCGLDEMILLKTAHSGFEGFKRDEYTTLKETADRLLGTAVSASWMYAEGATDFHHLRRRVRESLLHTFATHDSRSVQQTLYAMAEEAIGAVDELDEITLTMPNRHNILVDLAPFGQSNHNEVFMPIDDPSGYIQARVTRA